MVVRQTTPHDGLEGLPVDRVALAFTEALGFESAIVNATLPSFPVFSVDAAGFTCDGCDLVAVSSTTLRVWTAPGHEDGVAALLNARSLGVQAEESLAVAFEVGSARALLDPNDRDDVRVAGWTRRRLAP